MSVEPGGSGHRFAKPVSGGNRTGRARLSEFSSRPLVYPDFLPNVNHLLRVSLPLPAFSLLTPP